MTPPDQSGGLVFGFSSRDVEPGSRCRAVVVQLVPAFLAWQGVHEGDVLPCYEGARVVGHGRVLWREDIPGVTDADEARWLAWLSDPNNEQET